MTNLEIIREQIKSEIEQAAEAIIAEAKLWDMTVNELSREIGKFRNFKAGHVAQALLFEVRERVEIEAHARNKGIDGFAELKAEWLAAMAAA